MSIRQTFHHYFTELADERVNDWPLVGSPYEIPLILVVYVYLVLHYGPRYMEKRTAYSLKAFMQCYNVLQIVVNFLIVYNLMKAGCFTATTIYCEPFRYTLDYREMRYAELLWYALLSKLLDLVETCVFVLRKKQKQISLLHLYHHVSTVITAWLTVKYVAGVMSAIVMAINCSVHVIMYTYYFASTLDERVRKSIEFVKPIVTIVQMVQLVVLMVYVGQMLLPTCPMQNLPAYLMNANLLINFVLFCNFYTTNYTKRKSRQKEN